MEMWTEHLTDESRLQTMNALDMLIAPGSLFDRMTDLASQVMQTPVSLVSIVAADFQFNAGQRGVPEPSRSERRLSLDYSYCKHLLGTTVPLIVPDTRENPLLRHNLAIRDFHMIAYLGMPVGGSGKSFGSFCVLDNKVRHWTKDEIQVMHELAQIINSEIELRAKVTAGAAQPEALDERRQQIHRLIDQLDAALPPTEFLAQLRQQRKLHAL